MSDAPTPRFAIGDTIWTPGIEGETRQFDCPDCLNTRKWTITTPAGSVITTGCKRCTPGYVSSHDLPSLKYQAYKGVAYARKITGLEINLPEFAWDASVQYKCYTSKGGGHMVSEPNAYATKEEALAVAEADVAERNAAILSTAVACQAKHLSDLTIEEAAIDEFKSGLWDAWYAYRRLKSDIEELIGDEADPSTKDELVEALEDAMRWEKDHRDVPALTALINAAVGADPTSDVGLAYAKLPEMQRKAFVKEDA